MHASDPHAVAGRQVPVGHGDLLCSAPDACGKSGLMKIATSPTEGQSTFGEAALAGVTLDRADREPLHRQLASELKRLILAQTIAPGARLPSSRLYAEELGVSRATVVAAVDELIAEGYAEGRHGSGVFVAPDLP